MRWRKKNNSAWAVIVPDFHDYEFLPLTQALGADSLQKLFNLNFKWQSQNLDFIKKNLDQNADYFFYTPKNTQLQKVIKKTIEPHKIRFILRPKLHPGFVFKIISDKLVKTYNRVTIWNLESLVISPDILLETIKPDTIFTIKNPRDGLIMISYNMGTSNKEIQHETIILPALYDMESIRDTLAYMNSHDSLLYRNRSEELGMLFSLIRQNPG